ncbi:glycosyltransferase [Paenibacillus sp. MCAF20]
MKVAVLTMFNGLAKTYSLVSVVEEHLHMLLDAGVKVKLLVSQDCPDSERFGIFADDRLEWVKITNRLQGQQIHWMDYSQPTGRVHEAFYDEAATIAESLYEALKHEDVCIMHDILYQGWHLVHNVAVRIMQRRLPNLRFLAMSHSMPIPRPARMDWPLSARYTPLPNTTYLYPTQSGLAALARQYNVPLERCRAISNCCNPYAEFSQELQQLAAKTDLLSPDIVAVYPGRLTPGKQQNKAAALAGAIAAASGKRVKLVFCDFPSLDIEVAAFKRMIVEAGMHSGLHKEDIVFTSDAGWPDGFPHRSVMELFTISNLFICPSYSESFGLIVLEAASRGNFIVLNEAVPALEELGKQLHAYFMRWNARNIGYDTQEHYHPSERHYMLEHAAAIVGQMEQNPVLHAKTIARQRYNPKWIWQHQLKPLLEEV